MHRAQPSNVAATARAGLRRRRYIGAMSHDEFSLIEQAAHAVRRFQFMARLHLARPHRRGLAREAQAVFDLLWRMGFRPKGGKRALGRRHSVRVSRYR